MQKAQGKKLTSYSKGIGKIKTSLSNSCIGVKLSKDTISAFYVS